MMNIRRCLRRGEGAQTLAEFAIILPVLILVIFSLVDLARAMQSYVTVQHGARDGARYAVTGRIDCTGASPVNRDNCIRQKVKERIQDLNNAGSATISFRSWDFPAYADPPTANSAGQQCDAVEVQVTYNYDPITPLFNSFISNIPMTAAERMVIEPYGTCS
jgi:Flp pilus assembly protein TadG